MQIDVNALKDSNEFLNTLLQNIDTAVFIADESLQIQQFNESFLTLFSGQVPTGNPARKSHTQLLESVPFGNAAGCINAIQENKPCGETSVCQNCSLKKALLNTLKSQQASGKQFLERIFFVNGLPVKKFLEFSSRPIIFNDQKMILFFVYDITQIKESKLELEEKQKQIDIDLEKAGEIQKSLLPKDAPNIETIRADWFFEPSLTIGGDIFHIHKENESHINAYILDVCGHGVSAALIAVTVKQFMDQLYTQGLSRNRFYSPAQILNALEAEFPFERFDCYFTIAYARLNITTGKLVYGCAGHVPPLVVGQDKFEVLDRHGMIIGLGQDPPLEEYVTHLNHGDKIVLYTDGLIDYFGEKGAGPNKDNFYDVLKKSASMHPDEMVDQVMRRQRELKDDKAADDDISLVIIEYK